MTGEQIGKFRGHWIDWFSGNCKTNITNIEEFYECVDTHLFKKDEMIKKTVSFSFETTLVHELSTEWSEFIESMFHGRCFTAPRVGNLDELDTFKVMLNESQSTSYM